jgi:hypothetical protein
MTPPLRFIAATAVCLAVAPVIAQDLAGFVGTIGMSADTLQRSGEMAGCTLNYQAAALDHTYRKGALVIVAGSFNLNLIGQGSTKTVAPLLKVGIQQFFPKVTGGPQAPVFAYLQTPRGTTARSVVGDDYSDTPGFRIFALKLDENTAAVIGDIVDGEPVSLNYSSTKGGLDVKVPLDIRVVDSKQASNGIERVRGDATLAAFRECFTTLAKQLK